MNNARAVVAGLSVVASVVLIPAPAWACSCSSRDVEDSLEAGYAVAVVKRTDRGSTPSGDGNEIATLEVEASIGPALPDRLTAELYFCLADLPRPGGLGALVFQQRRTVPPDPVGGDGPGPGDPDDWVLYKCASADLGEAVRRIQGGTATPGEGRAVALTWGWYDNTPWLAALDARGRPLTWDERGDHVVALGVCPGGTVAAVASETYSSDGYVGELTLRDVPTLQPRRRISLAQEDRLHPRAVRCADPDGRAVDILAACQSGCTSPAAWLLRVRDGRVTATRLPAVDQAVAVAGGFVAVESSAYKPDGEMRSPVVRIAPDGTRTVLSRVDGAPSGIAVSPDGRTIAVSAGDLRTLDARTGRRLARWMPPTGVEVHAVGWTSRGLLAVTYPLREPTMTMGRVVFDAALRPVEQRPDAPEGWRAVVGDALVTFNRGRLAVTPPSGPVLEADELMLARASGVVGLPGGAFAPGPAGARPRTSIRVVLDRPDPSGPGAGVLALGALVAAALLRIVWRARP